MLAGLPCSKMGIIHTAVTGLVSALFGVVGGAAEVLGSSTSVDAAPWKQLLHNMVARTGVQQEGSSEGRGLPACWRIQQQVALTLAGRLQQWQRCSRSCATAHSDAPEAVAGCVMLFKQNGFV
jgi:hypothetical protein